MPEQYYYHPSIDAFDIFSSETPVESVTGVSRLLVLRIFSPEVGEVGYLNAMFQTSKKYDFPSDSFVEHDRWVHLGDVKVLRQADHGKGRKGIGTKLVNDLEAYARKFGANRIEGSIAPQDRKDQSWLPEFYEKLGFTVFAKGEGDWTITKVLSDPTPNNP